MNCTLIAHIAQNHNPDMSLLHEKDTTHHLNIVLSIQIHSQFL